MLCKDKTAWTLIVKGTIFNSNASLLACLQFRLRIMVQGKIRHVQSERWANIINRPFVEIRSSRSIRGFPVVKQWIFNPWYSTCSPPRKSRLRSHVGSEGSSSRIGCHEGIAPVRTPSGRGNRRRGTCTTSVSSSVTSYSNNRIHMIHRIDEGCRCWPRKMMGNQK
jgi:hypothetical protein